MSRRPAIVRPNFLLIGAPKAGTTSLARYLAQHPSVFVSPIKEPCFFAPEVVTFEPPARESFERDRMALRAYLDGPTREPRSHGIVVDWCDYLSLFREAGAATAVGEASVAYLSSLNAPAALQERLPGVRLLSVLRDPADRLWSHFTAARIAGVAGESFGVWLDRQLWLEAGRTPPFGSVWAGYYGRHLARYRRSFPASQMHEVLYGDYARDPQAALRDVFTFLGVDADWRADTSERHNETREPRWPAIARASALVPAGVRALAPRDVKRRWRALTGRRVVASMPLADRARAIALYAEDIHALQSLLGRDLADWLDPQPRT